MVAKSYFKRMQQPEWTPRLVKLGILRPVRMQVTSGVNMNLDPGDLVSLTILRTHAWQPEVWDSSTRGLVRAPY